MNQSKEERLARSRKETEINESILDERQNNERRKLRDEARRDVVSRSKCVVWHVTVRRLKAAKHDGTKVRIKIT
jgi:hypothetical protein